MTWNVLLWRAMDLAPVAFWWTQFVSRIGSTTAGFDVVTYAVIVVLFAGVMVVAVSPGRRWNAPPIFIGALLFSLFLARLSWFLPLLPNPDEAQMLAGAQRLLKDPIFWRSVDGTTVGPLDYLPLLLLRLLGFPLSFATARFANVLTLWAAMVFLYLAARILMPEWASRLSVLPLLAFAVQPRVSAYSDFVQY